MCLVGLYYYDNASHLKINKIIFKKQLTLIFMICIDSESFTLCLTCFNLIKQLRSISGVYRMFLF